MKKHDRDNFIQGRELASISEKLKTFDVGDRMKNMDKTLTDLVDQTVSEAMKSTCEKVEKTYAVVIAVEKSTETGETHASQKVDKGKKSQHQPKLAKPGVTKRAYKKQRKEIVATNAKMNDFQDPMGIKLSVVELKRLGEFEAERKKPRTLLVALPLGNEDRLTLAKSITSGKKETKKSVYITCRPADLK